MDKVPLVCDTSVLLYLGRVNQEYLLPVWYEPVYVPEQVVTELDEGRLLRPDTIDPCNLSWANVVAVTSDKLAALPANRLGKGECAVIAFAFSRDVVIAGLDDRQARDLAMSLGLGVIGVVGVLIKARRQGLISSLRETLGEVERSGFRLSHALRDEALKLVGEDEPEGNQ